MAALSLVAAVVAWNLAYFFFVLILLGLLWLSQQRRGPHTHPRPGSWRALRCARVFSLVRADSIGDNRHALLSDREIVGLHVFTQFALLPVRLTLAIWGNVGAVVWLEQDGSRRAWALLEAISAAGKAPRSALSRRERCLGAAKAIARLADVGVRRTARGPGRLVLLRAGQRLRCVRGKTGGAEGILKTSTPMEKMANHCRVWTEVDCEALRANAGYALALSGVGAELMAVVKANAYGHGVRISSKPVHPQSASRSPTSRKRAKCERRRATARILRQSLAAVQRDAVVEAALIAIPASRRHPRSPTLRDPWQSD